MLQTRPSSPPGVARVRLQRAGAVDDHTPLAAPVLPRRHAVACLLASLAALPLLASRSVAAESAPKAVVAAGAASPDALSLLQEEAASAFAARDFPRAEAALSSLISLQPENPGWLEGRAQARTDGKRFEEALSDFDAALGFASRIAATGGGTASLARLLAGKALALEGLSRWAEALGCYDGALAAAKAAGYSPDPYVLNSRGNVLASMGRYAEARSAYQSALGTFQASRGYRRGASTTSRLDGAVYAASNAALMRAQLGDTAGAEAEAAAVRALPQP